MTRAAVVEDLQRWRPDVVLVDHCEDLSFEPCISLESLRVDLLEWFKRDPPLLGVVELCTGAAGRAYEVWCAKTAGTACQRLLTASLATAQ